jgi:hypothetical protein
MEMIKCSGKNCMATFETDGPLSPNAKYTCREHTTKGSDTVRFQATQFDKGLRIAKKPLGTSHIPNQGSDVLTADDIGLPYSWEDVKEVVGICECGHKWFEEDASGVIGECPECGGTEGIN